MKKLKFRRGKIKGARTGQESRPTFTTHRCGSISRQSPEYNNRAAWIPEKRTQQLPNLKNYCVSVINSALPQSRYSGITQPSLSGSLCRNFEKATLSRFPVQTPPNSLCTFFPVPKRAQHEAESGRHGVGSEH